MKKRRARLGDVSRSRTLSNRFVGRRTELKIFNDAVDKTLSLTDKSSADDWLYPHVFLIAGLGGIGKTSLLDEFLRLASSKAKSCTIIRIDAEKAPVSDEDSFMRFLTDELRRNEVPNFDRVMKDYLDIVAKRKEIRRKVEEEERAERTAEFDPLVTAAAKLISLPTGPVAPLAEEVVKFTAHSGARLVAGTYDEVVNRLFKRGKLDAEEYALIQNPAVVTERFMDGLGELSSQGALIIAIDSYERFDRILGLDKWLRNTILEESSPKSLWIISGRADAPFVTRYKETSKSELLVAAMSLGELTKSDIREYLEARGSLPEDAAEIANLVEVIELVSKGIPLGVRALTDMYMQHVEIGSVFKDMVNRDHTRRNLIRALTERFLKWCNGEHARNDIERHLLRRDRRWIEALAILGTYDKVALQFLFHNLEPNDPGNSDQLLDDLGERHSFIFAAGEQQMHDKVRETLRENLQMQPLSDWFQRLARAAEEYYSTLLKDFDNAVQFERNEIVGNLAWQEAAYGLLNATLWSDYHGRSGTTVFTKLAIEAYIFDIDFLERCSLLLKEFKHIATNYKQLVELWSGATRERGTKPETDSFTVKLWDYLRQSIDQWNLSPVQQAIVWLMSGQTLLLRGNYAEAINAYQRCDELLMEHNKKLVQMLSTGLSLSAAGLYSHSSASDEAEIKAQVTQAVKRASEIAPDLSITQETLGMVAVTEGNFIEAETAFRRVLNKEPQSVRALIGMGITNFVRKHYDEALAYIESALSIDANNIPAYILKAICYQIQKKYEPALAILKIAQDVDPTESKVYQMLGDIYYARRQFDQAASNYEQYKRLTNNTEMKLYINLGNSYLLNEEYDKALDIFRAASDINPNYAPAHAGVAMAHLKSGRKDNAARSAKRGLEIDPQYISCYTILGSIAMASKDYPAALAYFNNALQLDDKDVYALVERSSTYYKQHNYKEALIDLEKAGTIDLYDPDILVHQSLTYYKLERYEEALAASNGALEIEPENVSALNSRGITYLALGWHHEALADLNRAHELEPENAGILSNRANAHRAFDNFDEALRDVNEAISLDPKLAIAYAVRGRIHQLLHQHGNAIADFEKALRLDHDDEDDDINVDFGGYGLELSKAGNYSDAIRALKLDLRINPGTHYSIYNLAIATARGTQNRATIQREINKARKVFGNLRKQAKDDQALGIAIYGLAGLAAAENHIDEAFELITQALQLWPDVSDWMAEEPAWNDLRDHPIYQALVVNVVTSVKNKDQ